MREQVAGEAAILFLEGYLYDKPKGKEAFERAAKLCRQAGGKAGIALSDPFCVDRHRADFRRLVCDLDYVIGNQHEWESLYQTDLDSALAQAAQDAGQVVCTRSGDEVILVRGERILAVGPVLVPHKKLLVRLSELVVLYFLVGVIALLLEQRVGQRAPQGWEFYATTACLFLTLAFPGFVWRYLYKPKH